jgi:hypothetical protein
MHIYLYNNKKIQLPSCVKNDAQFAPLQLSEWSSFFNKKLFIDDLIYVSAWQHSIMNSFFSSCLDDSRSGIGWNAGNSVNSANADQNNWNFFLNIISSYDIYYVRFWKKCQTIKRTCFLPSSALQCITVEQPPRLFSYLISPHLPTVYVDNQ